MKQTKSYADRLEERGLRRQADLARKASVRPVITRGRHLENQDWEQLPMKSSNILTDTDGAFFFVPGISLVGSTDKVRPV